MRDLLHTLCNDINWKIRKTVATFIYQIGLIIGRDNANRDLVPIFMGFFMDLDEVTIEALRNLMDFLQIIDIPFHHKILFRLGCSLHTDNYTNWRFREELVQQVLNLIQKYGHVYNTDCIIYLTGIAVTLLSDEVCSVRDIALNAVNIANIFCFPYFKNIVFFFGQVVEKYKISKGADTTDLTNILIEAFADSSFWRKRQIFVNLCTKLVSVSVILSPSIF